MSDVRTFVHGGNTRGISLPQLSDDEVASKIRMLMRNDLYHEVVVVAARDRILCLTQENAKLHDQVKTLQNAILKSVSWCERAEHERQQSGPILRDYLAHARNAALDGLAAVPLKTPTSA